MVPVQYLNIFLGTSNFRVLKISLIFLTFFAGAKSFRLFRPRRLCVVINLCIQIHQNQGSIEVIWSCSPFFSLCRRYLMYYKGQRGFTHSTIMIIIMDYHEYHDYHDYLDYHTYLDYHEYHDYHDYQDGEVPPTALSGAGAQVAPHNHVGKAGRCEA